MTLTLQPYKEHTLYRYLGNTFAMSKLFYIQSTKETASSVDLLCNSSQKEAVGKIFDRILTMQYEDPETKVISLDDLLQWDLWPNYIRIFSKYLSMKFLFLLTNFIHGREWRNDCKRQWKSLLFLSS